MTRSNEILTLIPHREPVLLVDEIYTTETGERSRYTINENVFLLDDRFDETGVIEHMAQSVAAVLSKQFTKQAQGIPVLASIGKLKILRPVKRGEVLETTITINAHFGTMVKASASTSTGGEAVAECEMNLSLVYA